MRADWSKKLMRDGVEGGALAVFAFAHFTSGVSEATTARPEARWSQQQFKPAPRRGTRSTIVGERYRRALGVGGRRWIAYAAAKVALTIAALKIACHNGR